MKYFVMFWLLLCGCDEFQMVAYETIIVTSVHGKYAVLEGDYDKDVYVKNTDATHIRGTVRIIDGAYLRIEGGSVLYGEWETRGKLIVEDGAFCIGSGTYETPIIFTTDHVKNPHMGDWEGIVLNGLTRMENVVVEYAKVGVTVNHKLVRIYNGIFHKNRVDCEGMDEKQWRR